jgi:hypothetical protein
MATKDSNDVLGDAIAPTLRLMDKMSYKQKVQFLRAVAGTVGNLQVVIIPTGAQRAQNEKPKASAPAKGEKPKTGKGQQQPKAVNKTPAVQEATARLKKSVGVLKDPKATAEAKAKAKEEHDQALRDLHSAKIGSNGTQAKGSDSERTDLQGQKPAATTETKSSTGGMESDSEPSGSGKEEV